jgi:quinol-cytochrome oxidoreductase complex cytochrome b subunit
MLIIHFFMSHSQNVNNTPGTEKDAAPAARQSRTRPESVASNVTKVLYYFLFVTD